MNKKLLIMVEVIGGIVGIISIIIFWLDHYFNTNIISTITQDSSAIEALLDIEETEIQYDPINTSDPFYINLQKNFLKTINAESIKSIKVQTISDTTKKFILTDKTNQNTSIIITKTWNNFIIQKEVIK